MFSKQICWTSCVAHLSQIINLFFKLRGIEMSTDYYVTLTASDGTTTPVKLIDSINPLPFSDTFESDEAALGNKGGKAVFGTDAVVMHTGPGGAGNVTLDGFNAQTKKGDSGTGNKTNDLGTFPDGDFTWHCDRID